MADSNKITNDDIKKISSLNNSEIEQKLKGILSDSNNGALKKLLSNVDVASLKKKLESSNKEDIEKFSGILSKLDPSLISKIKDSLK